MQNLRFLLKPKYENSYALIIGINNYKTVSPLSYAVSDAEEITSILIDKFNFPKDNVTILVNETATKENILTNYSKYINKEIQIDDRIFVFFAGHGHTETGIRGEIGFLVPFDADINNLSTLIRWEELTSNSEMIRAKHMLFIMDACYGGLALTRSLQPGSTRFLNDMLLRYSRQVLTAGKADEVVADSGGPLPQHSVFTGHLIQGLLGDAFSDNGVLTASAIMSYVYSKVSNDRNSNQTPHYGYFDGDGDFVLKAPLEILEKDSDTIVVIPFSEMENTRSSIENKIIKIKKLLSSENTAIELYDFCTDELRCFLSLTDQDNFQIQGSFSTADFINRISKYEESINDLSILTACISYWAKPIHMPLLQKLFARITDRLDSQSGLVIWLYLRWYPIVYMLYCSGISAVENNRYDSLSRIFFTKITSPDNKNKEVYLVEAVGKTLSELSESNVFKSLPGYEKNLVPMSEYLFKMLQPKIDDLLFIGKNYERAFDKFEVMLSLIVADLKKEKGEYIWGPIGRFGYKNIFPTEGPLQSVLIEAKELQDNWEPLKNGFFGGSYSRFEKLFPEVNKLISKRGWS